MRTQLARPASSRSAPSTPASSPSSTCGPLARTTREGEAGTRRDRSRRFVRLPVDLLSHPMVLGLHFAAFKLYLTLWALTEGQQPRACQVSLPRLAKQTGLDVSSIPRATRQLSEKGLVSVTASRALTKNGTPGAPLAHVYSVHEPTLEETSP